jgi:hypothetical protein
LRLPQHDREEMGKSGRTFVRRQFDEQIVFAHYLQALDRLGLQSARKTQQDPGPGRLAVRDGVAATDSRKASAGRTGPGVKEDSPASVL